MCIYMHTDTCIDTIQRMLENMFIENVFIDVAMCKKMCIDMFI